MSSYEVLEGVDLNQPAAEVVGAEVPGTGDQTQPGSPDPPAEALKTDTDQRGTPPETIPYSRFSEVVSERNSLQEKLEPYEELEKYGYVPEELRRLAEWEASFEQNPVDSWLSVARAIKDQLPDPVRAAIEQVEGGVDPVASNSNSGASETPTLSAPEPSEMEKRLKELEDREEARENERAEAWRQETLSSIVSTWKAADATDGIQSPSDKTMYTYIAAVARRAEKTDDIWEMARGDWLEERDNQLKTAVQRPGNRVAPKAVPGSTAPAGADPPKPATLAEASELAKAAIESGHLPWKS